MSPHPLQKAWESLAPDQMVEIALIQVRLSCERQTPANSSRDLGPVWDAFRDSLHAIAELHGGKLLSWHEQDGSFMLPIENDESLDNCCIAAIQMLEMLPSIVQDLRQSNHVDFPIAACFLCDTGNVSYHPEPNRTAGNFVDRCQEHCRSARADNALIVTERVYCQLSRPLMSRFATTEYSPELNIDLHSTLPLSRRTTSPLSASTAGPLSANGTLPESPTNAPSIPIDVVSEPAVVGKNAPPGATRKLRAKIASAGRFVQRLPTSVKPWQKVAIGLVAAAVLHIALDRFVPTPTQATTSPNNGVLSARVHKIFAKKPVTEASLIETSAMCQWASCKPRPRRFTGIKRLPARLRRSPASKKFCKIGSGSTISFLERGRPRPRTQPTTRGLGP